MTGGASIVGFRRLPCEAEIFLADGFLGEAEIESAIAEGAAAAAGGAIGQRSVAGFSYEMPSTVPVVAVARERMAAAFGFMDQGGSLRFRRYGAGEYHPPHLDDYAMNGQRLLVTAMIWLTEDFAGGETEFPHAGPALALRPKRGRVAIWRNVRPDGQADETAYHAGRRIARGSKITLTGFFYGQPEWPLAFAERLRPAAAFDPGDVML